MSGKIAFVSSRDGNENIYVMNADGTKQTQLTSHAGSDFAPSWSPDGSKIAFQSDRDGDLEVYVMNASGNESGVVQLTHNDTFRDDDPSWSPDGSEICFHSDRDGNEEVYKMNTDGSGQVNLSNNTSTERYCAWSPDGTWVAFGSLRTGDFQIWKMRSADGTQQTQIISNPGEDETIPDWEPGSKILHLRGSASPEYGIYTLKDDGSDQTPVKLGGGNSDPAWSPDGEQIVFASNRDGALEVYVMRADGSGQRRLTFGGRNLHPDWQLTSDTDGDGCTDKRQLRPSSDANLGGGRNPKLFWDFFDVPTPPGFTRDRAVSVGDIQAVVARFGSVGDRKIDPLSAPGPPPAYHTGYDRTLPGDPMSNKSQGPNGSVTIQDIALAVAQFGHSCL